jgi:preprotein translocase subunit YajC
MTKAKYFLLPALLTGSLLFAEEGEAVANNSQGGFMQTIVMIGIALVFFYFILYRPEQKRRKKSEQMRNSLKKGDRITAMGIIGTVSSVKDNTVIVKMCDGAKVEFLKGAITDVQPATEEKTEKETELSSPNQS